MAETVTASRKFESGVSSVRLPTTPMAEPSSSSITATAEAEIRLEAITPEAAKPEAPKKAAASAFALVSMIASMLAAFSAVTETSPSARIAKPETFAVTSEGSSEAMSVL